MNPVVTRICEATPLKEIEMGQAVNCVVNPFFFGMFCNVFICSLLIGTTFQQQQALLKQYRALHMQNIWLCNLQNEVSQLFIGER